MTPACAGRAAATRRAELEAVCEAQRARHETLAARLVGEDAEDVVQEAYARAFAAVDRFGGRSALSTWLHRIVLNGALSHRARRQLEERGAEATALALLPTAEADPLAQVLREAPLPAGLLAAVEALPADQRQVLLGTAAGLDGPTLARALGRELEAIKSLRFRARHATRARLRGCDWRAGELPRLQVPCLCGCAKPLAAVYAHGRHAAFAHNHGMEVLLEARAAMVRRLARVPVPDGMLPLAPLRKARAWGLVELHEGRWAATERGRFWLRCYVGWRDAAGRERHLPPPPEWCELLPLTGEGNPR